MGEFCPVEGDLMTGADKIGSFLGVKGRSIYHLWETTDIPIFKLGSGKKAPLCARKSTLSAWIREKETAGRRVTK
jgi:hypothetical protein